MRDPEVEEIFERLGPSTSPPESSKINEIIAEANNRTSAARSGRRRLLIGAVAAVAIVGSLQLFFRPVQELDIGTVGTSPDTSDPLNVPSDQSQVVDVPDGVWLSELVPLVASQVEGVTEAQLESVLKAQEIAPQFRPAGSVSWEGLLLPGSYQFEQGVNATDVVRAMSNRLAEAAVEIGYGSAGGPTGYSDYEILIVASIVEAEAETDEDRAKIARVIYNRMMDDHPVSIDSALVYGLGDRQIELTQETLLADTPYNLRINPGLPPTPIGAPSRESMEAALNPAEGDWIFYIVADSEGNKFFTANYEDFLEQKELSESLGLL